MTDPIPILPDFDQLVTGEEMLERAREVAESVTERIRKVTDRANRLVEAIDSSIPLPPSPI
jgi:hypothetical protein